MTKIDTTRPPKLIALCGLEGAGKSETAKCLRVAYGYTIRSFAEPIKAYLSALGVPHASLYGTPEQKAAPIPEFGGKSGRELMVGLGEYTARRPGPTVFARALMTDIADIQDHAYPKLIVIDDLRFPDEFLAVRAAGGVVWCVTRGHYEMVRHSFVSVIVNDGDIPALHERVAALLR